MRLGRLAGVRTVRLQRRTAHYHRILTERADAWQEAESTERTVEGQWSDADRPMGRLPPEPRRSHGERSDISTANCSKRPGTA